MVNNYIITCYIYLYYDSKIAHTDIFFEVENVFTLSENIFIKLGEFPGTLSFQGLCVGFL